jgi:hypothetical protein
LISYIIYITIFLAVLFPAIYLIRRKPDISFWFLVNIYFDPGGYIDYYLKGKIFLNLYISDFVIVLILICLFAINTNYKIIYKDQFFIKFLKVFLIFAVYFFVFYGGIVPYLNNDFNYSLFLQKNRNFLYYIIILISVYIFTMRDLKYFYFTTLFLGLLILSAFLVSLITGLKIIPIDIFERYSGSEMMRITILSWGLFQILFPLSFIVYLFARKIKINIKYRKLLYIAGMLMVVTLLITLTRRNFISVPGIVLIIILLNSYIFRKSKIFAIAKVLVPVSLILLIVYFTLPKYVNYIVNISQDTYELLTKGSDTSGEREYRVSGTGDLLLTKKYISNNFILGTGYSYLYWGESEVATSPRGSEYALASDAAREVPIYNIFFSYGLTGFIIMVFLYAFLIRLFLRLYSLLKKQIKYLIVYPYELLFAIFILYMIVDKFTFSLYTMGSDFTSTYYGIFIGIGFALLRKLKIITSNIEINQNSRPISN